MAVTAHQIVREKLDKIDNVGVVLSRLAPPQPRSGQRAEQQAQLDFLHKLGAATPGGWYNKAFRRWESATPPSATRRVLRFKTDSPLTVGMGEASPLENGLSLHPTYGTPILPGSSLKGVCRAFCAQRFAPGDPWAVGGDAFGTLFGRGGDDGEVGAVDFLDGLLEPGGGGFKVEVLTPHHGSYYQEDSDYQEESPPRGWDGPVPVHFLAVEGSFRVVLEGPPAWLEPARQILVTALSHHGVGAKTRAGHGRLSLREEERPAAGGAGDGPGGDGTPASVFDQIVAGNTNIQQIKADLRAWVLGRSVRIQAIANLDRNDDATCRAVAAWMVREKMPKTWKKQRNNPRKAGAAKTCLDFVQRWAGGE